MFAGDTQRGTHGEQPLGKLDLRVGAHVERTTATGAVWSTQFILHSANKMPIFCLTIRDTRVLLVLLFFSQMGVEYFPGERKRKVLGCISQLHWLDREVLYLERNYSLLIWYFWHRTSLRFGFMIFCLLCLYCAQQIKGLLSSASGINGLPIQQQPAYSTGQLFACAHACRGDVCLCSAACDTAGRGLSHLCYPCCLKQLCFLGCLEHLGVSWVTSVGPLQPPEIDITISYILHIYMLSNYKYKINICIFN